MTEYSTGNIVPETGKYRCGNCGPQGAVAKANATPTDPAPAIDLAKQPESILSFTKGAKFTQCPNCAKVEGDPTRWSEVPETRSWWGWGKPKKDRPKQKEGTRETVESILFAFVLAFLFRTFEAEAFVIPTGSMAPTLYGRHKETDCTMCGNRIVLGASEELDRPGYLLPERRIHSAMCSNCGFRNEQIFDALAFTGDRILVNKYPYEFGDPDRWDVFVFKYPEEPKTNYIKRLVGLPGETIRIRGGNVYSWDGLQEAILRKDPTKQAAIQIPVYDDTHAPLAMIEAGWPERWAGVVPSDVGRIEGWKESDSGWQGDTYKRTYAITSEKSPQRQWLRYRHFMPMPGEWKTMDPDAGFDPKARLITDLCPYNANAGGDASGFNFHGIQQVDTGPYWDPDLTVSFDIDIKAATADSELLFELIEGVSSYRCRVALDSGTLVLEEINAQMNGRVRELASVKTSIRGTGSYSVQFANVDDRICCWINGSLIPLGEGAIIDNSGATSIPGPTQADLSPVGIAATNVTATVSNLMLKRDIYYRADFLGSNQNYHPNQSFENDLIQLTHQPDEWTARYLKDADRLDFLEIKVEEEHYLALGDNSPRSKDSRLWTPNEQTVPERLLVGKAFMIYWPHGVPFLNGGRGFAVKSHVARDGQGSYPVEDYPRFMLPFYPQVKRMKRIR